ncbi:MAG: metallophosphoesterase [Thermodesulfobacteriota bacterium]
MVFFLIYTGALALIYGYVGRRLTLPARPGRKGRIAFWSLTAFLFFLAPASILFEIYDLRFPGRPVLDWIGYLGLGYFTLAFSLLLIRDAGLLALWIGRALPVVWRAWRPARPDPDDPDDPPDPERRRFLLHSMNLGLAGLTGALSGYGLHQARRTPETMEVTATLPNLPPAFEGFRLVQISDLHVGPTVGRGFVEAVVKRVNALAADAVVFTGDLADGPVAELRPQVAPLAGLAAPAGRFFVTGNHEYYSGVGPWVDEAARLGFTVLLNEHRVLERNGDRMVLAGVTDLNGGRFLAGHKSSPIKALADAPPGLTRILLAHQPASVFEAAAAGADLMLCGHTHGGQYFPLNYLAYLAQPYVHGLHQYRNTLVYVSRGAGYWGPPLRLMAPSEITVITLRRG